MQVLLFASLARSFGAGGLRLEEGPSTVGEVVERLKALGGRQFRAELSDLSVVNILVNGRNIEFLNGLATRVSSNDTITLIPPVAGG
ncbi:MAG: MoaD/ThiS family protein [Alicyclobacillus sp.]|nr:MoaD/ThiS family protein [Alicyclobacillus sp.]